MRNDISNIFVRFVFVYYKTEIAVCCPTHKIIIHFLQIGFWNMNGVNVKFDNRIFYFLCVVFILSYLVQLQRIKITHITFFQNFLFVVAYNFYGSADNIDPIVLHLT